MKRENRRSGSRFTFHALLRPRDEHDTGQDESHAQQASRAGALAEEEGSENRRPDRLAHDGHGDEGGGDVAQGVVEGRVADELGDNGKQEEQPVDGRAVA